MRTLTFLWLLILFAGTADAQQPRAPAGGAWNGGHFYKGGQFMPMASGMPGYSAPSGGSLGAPSYFAPDEPRVAYRKRARTRYRTEAKETGGADVEPDALAISHLQMAKSLMKMGKYKEAGEWL